MAKALGIELSEDVLRSLLPASTRGGELVAIGPDESTGEPKAGNPPIRFGGYRYRHKARFSSLHQNLFYLALFAGIVRLFSGLDPIRG